MLKFDFSKYMNSFLDLNQKNKLESRKAEIYQKFNQSKMTAWYKDSISQEEIIRIKTIAATVRNNSDILLVIGIGGSYMGSYSLKQLLLNPYKKDKIEVIYIGNSLSATSLNEVMEYIKDKELSVNVISKSGSTLEIKLTYQYIKEFMKNKYSEEELKQRIIITTNSELGFLKEEVEKNKYIHFDMPKEIGGRYSIITAAHLFPLAVMNCNIDNFLIGYEFGKKYIDDAYSYAVIRKMMYDQGKYIENYSVYEPKLYYYIEFLKQLFGESEGKDGKGIIPISTVNTRDLHSLGQIIQDGSKIIFETTLQLNLNDDIKFLNHSFSNYNKIVCESVRQAHYEGKVPNLMIELEGPIDKTIGEVTIFFMMAAAFSAYLFDVDPFNQPGVEKYKNIVNTKISI